VVLSIEQKKEKKHAASANTIDQQEVPRRQPSRTLQELGCMELAAGAAITKEINQ
jgi:hypothetical protein